MKKADFIELWCRVVAAGRKRNFPDIRASEAAAMGIEDAKKADIVWRKYRLHFRDMTPNEAASVLGTRSSQDAATLKLEKA